MQAPLVERSVLAAAPIMTRLEREQMPIESLQRARAMYFLEENRDRQFRHLMRLDNAQRVCARLGIGPESIRRTFGRIIMPGIPASQIQTDVVGIMTLPRDTPEMSITTVRTALKNSILAEPEPRPLWLMPNDTWPPPR